MYHVLVSLQFSNDFGDMSTVASIPSLLSCLRVHLNELLQLPDDGVLVVPRNQQVWISHDKEAFKIVPIITSLVLVKHDFVLLEG